MKRTEFVNEVLLAGYFIDVGRYHINIKDECEKVLFQVSESTRYKMSSSFEPFDKLDDDKQEMLFYLVADYASTPTNKRQRTKMTDDQKK